MWDKVYLNNNDTKTETYAGFKVENERVLIGVCLSGDGIFVAITPKQAKRLAADLQAALATQPETIQ